MCRLKGYAAVSLQTGHWSAHWSVTHVISEVLWDGNRTATGIEHPTGSEVSTVLLIISSHSTNTRPSNSRKLKTFSRWILMIFIFKLALPAFSKVRSFLFYRLGDSTSTRLPSSLPGECLCPRCPPVLSSCFTFIGQAARIFSKWPMSRVRLVLLQFRKKGQFRQGNSCEWNSGHFVRMWPTIESLRYVISTKLKFLDTMSKFYIESLYFSLIKLIIEAAETLTTITLVSATVVVKQSDRLSTTYYKVARIMASLSSGKRFGDKWAAG